MTITLDENHIYHDESGIIIPGVTQVLRDAGLIDASWFTDYARERGGYVHQACALYDQDDLDMDSLDPAIEPYVQAWIKFRKDTGFMPVLVEQIVFNKNYNYAGTLDVTGEMGDQLCLIDRKSGARQSWSALQTAGYTECLSEHHRRFVIELDSDSKYHLIEYKNRNDIKIFLAALAVVTWKKNKGVK